MSLLNEYEHDCAVMVKTAPSDRQGGTSTSWQEGQTFKAVIGFTESTTVEKAAHEATRDQFIVLTDIDVDLPYHAVFKRLSDGAIFRITTTSHDHKTPPSSNIRKKGYNAEAWKLT